MTGKLHKACGRGDWERNKPVTFYSCEWTVVSWNVYILIKRIPRVSEADPRWQNRGTLQKKGVHTAQNGVHTAQNGVHTTTNGVHTKKKV